jgi:hypothetical protein
MSVAWSTPVPNEVAARRAGGRRGYNKRRRQQQQARQAQVKQLVRRWGTSPAARLKMALALGVSVKTIARDLQAARERPPLPLVCPLCGLPSRLDVNPADVTDPAQLEALEMAMERYMGAPQTAPGRRSPRPTGVAPRPAVTRAPGAVRGRAAED